MKPADLQKALREVEPAAVLVPVRVLENIVRKTYDLTGLLGRLPQRATFVADRQMLYRHVDQEDLALEPDQVLPATVILLAWPTQDDLQNTPDLALLLKYWQRLFNACVRLELDRQFFEGRLNRADLRHRIEELGPAAFEEVRSVLQQDRFLQAESDDRTVWVEFAAVFLENYYFSPGILPSLFPGLRDLERVRELLSRDVDAQHLFERTRLTGAGDPTSFAPSSSGEAHEFFWKLIVESDHARDAGNVVRAAILRRRAARVAPAAQGYDTRNEALEMLKGLLHRLQKALELSDAEVHEWSRDLPTLLDKADQGNWPPEAALLYDLQKVCLDSEREIYSLDVVEWVLSVGKRPIRRPLPSLRMVRMTRHLSSATQRLTLARLSEDDRNHLAGLLEAALHRCQERLRERFRPLLITALEDVGLQPRNPPEKVAFHKVVEEVLDSILKAGFLTFSDLRDILSRNQLKMPDLSDPQDFIRGDPLIRLDRRLATFLDGVYKPSEFYLRWLERFTSLQFGTMVGRLLTLWLTLPFLGAFLTLEVAYIFLEKAGVSERPPWAYWSSLALLSFFVCGLIHSRRLRQRCRDAGAAALVPFRVVFLDWPTFVLKHPGLRQFLASWPVQLVLWYLLKPLILVLLLRLLAPGAMADWVNLALAFFAANFLVNSRPGKAAGEALSSGLRKFIELLRAGLIPGLVRKIVSLFKNLMHLWESLLFTVDDWLRFRGGESRGAMVARVVMGIVWFPISYLARFNMVVLIEPCLHPLKLPICSLAAKLVYPMIPVLKPMLTGFFEPVMGSVLSEGLTWWILFWSPDIAGFLFWEMKENWSLYRANRNPNLVPVGLGAHGETLPQLLRPGFHSGILPKSFARLRHAERAALKSGNWSSVRGHQRHLREIEEAVRLFLEREFLALLKLDPAWLGKTLDLEKIHLATNRIEAEILTGTDPDRSVLLQFEERNGWLLAGLGDDGAALERLSSSQKQALHNALVGLFKLAGVDLLRDQLREKLPATPAVWQFRYEGLVFWLDERRTQPVLYDLRTPLPAFLPTSPEETALAGWPVLEGEIVFRHMAVTWLEWTHTWKPPRGRETPWIFERLPVLERSPARSRELPLLPASESGEMEVDDAGGEVRTHSGTGNGTDPRSQGFPEDN